MRCWRASFLTSLVIGLFCRGAVAAPRAPTLPLSRVRLYETGVGYFERSGSVATGETALPVPAGHLDDALKTLVVLSGDTKVRGVAFTSSVSSDMARKLAGLPEQGDEPLSFSELSRTFKGAGVTIVTAGGQYSGRLVDVLEPGQGELERCGHASAKITEGSTAEATCRLVQRGSLLLLGTHGELRRIASADVLSLRPSEPAARARLDAALDALSQRGAQTRRELGVLTSGGGKVTLGYVAEAPVWRSTYRIVLGHEQARLQGWALIHNDTDEDWQAVHVDLVNGRPTSFLYPLAAPRYARRELVTPAQELPSVPQLFDTTVDNLWSGGLGLNGMGEGGGGRGEGIGLGSVGTIGYGSGHGQLSGAQESNQLDVGNLAALVPAEGVEATAMFRYSLPTKLALAAHGSALVPFLDTAIEVRQIAWFSGESEAAASALHLTNDTHQTLPGGTLAIFGDGGFAGESLLPRSKPHESHLLAYGVDLDIELKRDRGISREESRLFSFEHETLEQHYVRRRTETLTLRNRSGRARVVYVELDVVDNARVAGAKQLGRDADTHKTYCVVDVAAGTEVTQALELEEGLRRHFAMNELVSDRLRELATIKTTQPSQRAALLRAADRLLAAERRRGAKPKRQAELEQTLADVVRVRENARILGAIRAKQGEGMAQRVVELEARVTQLRQRIAELTSEADAHIAAAKHELGGL
jgi:hypothetical protein